MKRKRELLEALVLSRRSSGEADRWVTFLTREYGVVRAMAKGVRKVPSQRGPHLEPGTKVMAVLHEGRLGKYVGTVETTCYFHDLREDAEALIAVQRVMRVVRGLFEELDQHDSLYELVEWAWEELPKKADEKRQLVEGAALLGLLRMGGFLPDFQSCGKCASTAPQEAVVLLPHEDGWKCVGCVSSLAQAQYSMSLPVLKLLKFLSREPRLAARVAVSRTHSDQLVQAVWQLAGITHPAQSIHEVGLRI